MASGVQRIFRPSADFLHLGHPGIDAIYGIERLVWLLTNGNYRPKPVVARSGKRTLNVKLRLVPVPVKRLQKQWEGMRAGDWSVQ